MNKDALRDLLGIDALNRVDDGDEETRGVDEMLIDTDSDFIPSSAWDWEE